MPRRTNPFQNLSAAIMVVFYEPDYLVEESVLERNPRTGVIREIDIRITNRKNPKDRILIECRAHGRRQDVQWIDALDGKARSLGFLKIVAVSSSGFTKAAITEAHDRGIDVLHLKQAEEVDWRKWMMAITELGVITEQIVLRSVSFGIDANWPGDDPDLTDLSDVVLIDTRDSTRIPLLSWIGELLNDPEQVAQIRALARNGKLNDLMKKHPCAPGMGFVVRGQEQFVPLAELTIHVDVKISLDSITLKHMDAGGERILTGESPVRGVSTRVVMHEQKDRGLSLLLEQGLPAKNQKNNK